MTNKLYDFDQPLVRKGSDCVKHDGLKHFFGRDDLLPMWVADMDFRSPDFVIQALRNRLDHEVLGYHYPSQSYCDAVQGWLAKHYNISSSIDELHFIPGIVAGISFAIQAFTKPGDGVLVTTPVYPPFVDIPSSTGRRLVKCPLVVENADGCNTGYVFRIDFDAFERCARECKLFVLSNPHNPGGTVWQDGDLCRIADICKRNGLIVISDEIHADLTLPGFHHTSFPALSYTAADISILFMAPSKTFNIAGLGSSVSYVHNPELRKRFYSYLDNYGVAGGNIFAFIGAEAALRHGEDWLRQLLRYLEGNVSLTRTFLNDKLPRIKAVLPQASYLVWLGFSDYGLSHDEIRSRLHDRAQLALNDGLAFGGSDYGNCFRLNIGCPRSTLLQALEKIKSAFDGNE